MFWSVVFLKHPVSRFKKSVLTLFDDFHRWVFRRSFPVFCQSRVREKDSWGKQLKFLQENICEITDNLHEDDGIKKDEISGADIDFGGFSKNLAQRSHWFLGVLCGSERIPKITGQISYFLEVFSPEEISKIADYFWDRKFINLVAVWSSWIFTRCLYDH